MSLYVNGTDIERVFVNGTEVHKLFCNGEKVWAHDIEFVGSTAASYSSTGTANASLSGIDVRAGDVMIAVTGMGSHTSSPLPNSPSGFSTIFSRSGGGSSTNALMRMSYRVATGSETNVSVSGTYSSSGGGVAVQIFRYVDTSNILDVSLTSFTGNTYTNNVNPRAITPVTQGAVIVAGGVSFSRGGGSASLSSNDLSSFRYAGGNGSSYGSVSGIGYRKWNGSGSYDPTSWSFSGDAGGANYMCATIALRPKY